jgi:hypothetical protein
MTEQQLRHLAAEILMYFDRMALQESQAEAVQHTLLRFGITADGLQRLLTARSIAERVR